MILLKNCFCVFDGTKRLYAQDILIKKNIIHSIGPTAAVHNPEVTEVVDCSDHLVIPGLVNTHHHFYQILTRNLPEVQNAELFDWLIFLYETWKNIDSEAVYYSSLAAMAELMKTGCTCSTDHHYLYPSAFIGDIMARQFEAAETLGMRFSPTRGSMSLSKKDGGLPPDSVVQTEEEILSDSERVISEYHDPSDLSMRRIILAPCSPFSVTTDLMKKSSELARRHGVLLHTHLAETFDENDFCVKKYGVRPLKLMQDCGFTGSDVSFAHGIHFNDEELEVLRDEGCSICHCPSSNMRLGSGIARVREMLDMGINVSLAVDGSASNDSSDMLSEVRSALMLQRVKGGAAALTADEALMMASRGGAKTLNFPRCGMLKEGWAADLAIYNMKTLDYAGSLSDPAAALIFCGYDHRTEHTMINGRFTVKNGRLTGFDEEDIIRNVNRIAARLRQQQR
ncbi:MAG: 8-oxoguanine deaminase [Spirochaetales bacterium]|nr:8-oxoguanine deaminase [Spirochaetales bacterium]